VEPRLRPTPRPPRTRAVRGERHRLPLLSRYDTASSTGRSPTASSNCMASNSQVHLRGTRPKRAARAGRCEYEQIRRRIQHADVVPDRRDGNPNATANRRGCGRSPRTSTRCTRSESRGSDVPAEVLGEDFAGTVVCDGWTAYPAFTSNLQRCWHIFSAKRKMSLKSTRTRANSPASHKYVGLQSWLETDPRLRERAQMHRSSQRTQIAR